ncbi:hypothetical protein GCM10027256_03880 [Novispirillum itersonii subsp. nipponicum]
MPVKLIAGGPRRKGKRGTALKKTITVPDCTDPPPGVKRDHGREPDPHTLWGKYGEIFPFIPGA